MVYADKDARLVPGNEGQVNTSADCSKQVDEILTVAEVSALKKVPKSWVYARTRRRAADSIPHYKFGKYVRFSAAEVDAFFASMRGR